MKRLEGLLKQKSRGSLAKPLQASMILDRFKKICEQNLSSDVYKSIRIISYCNNTIKISCSNSIVAQEVKLKESKLLNTINHEFNRKIAEKIAYC